MKKTEFTETQITGILKAQEQGLKVANICRKHGISDATFYNWKSNVTGYSGSGLGVSIGCVLEFDSGIVDSKRVQPDGGDKFRGLAAG